MGVSENGRPIESVKDRPNGHPTGGVVVRKPSQRSWSLWLFNTLARLTIWYTLFVAVFQCPSSVTDIQDSTPKICKPYLEVRSHLQPYVQPYYDTYASPYVDNAWPYAEKLNTHAIAPASVFAKQNYVKFAAPRIDQAKAYGLAQWEKSVLPQIVVAQKRAAGLYDQNLAPHVEKASSVAGPYYESARDNAVGVHQKHILPAIDQSKPYLQKAYATSRDFALFTAVPYSQYAWNEVVIFVDGTLWPRMKGLYGDNVKPQLVMISERIAKYQEGRKLKAVMEEVESSMEASTATESSIIHESTVAATVQSSTEEPSVSSTDTNSGAYKSPPKDVEWASDESVDADLSLWQEKFTKAADRGADDLHIRVKDIITSLMKSNIDGEGKSLANVLTKTTENEFTNIKSKINSITSSLTDDASGDELEEAEKEIVAAIRASGQEIRTRATSVRQWYSKFEAEVQQRAKAASDSTLNVIDSIRDLGLQEIGMRWARIEGVTYKHWAKYHELRQNFDAWRDEVQDVASKHPMIDEAKAAGEVILEESMEVAAAAAKELSRLKGVAKWKIAARDSSDDFETRIIPAAAVSVASKVAEAVKDATDSIVGTSQGMAESIVSQATEAAADALSSVSSIVGTSQGSAESVVSKATGAAADALSSASSAILMETTKGLVDEATESASSVASVAVGSASSVAEVASSSISSAAEAIVPSSSVHDLSSSASSLAEEYAETVSSAASSATSSASRVFAGAMAQEVRGQVPILDDVFDDDSAATFSEKLQSVVNGAGDRYADVTQAVSEALYGTTQGTVESMTSVAAEQYSSALAAASSVLYGTPQGTAESIASVASDKYSQAVAAASIAIYGTPVPVTDSLIQSASSAYANAVSLAKEHYDSAKSIASVQISGTPKLVHEEMLSSIEAAYSGSVEAASGRLEAAMAAVSGSYSSLTSGVAGVFATPTQGTYESISSVAASRLQVALELASAQYSSAKTYVGATPTPVHQQVLSDARRKYYEAIGMAHDQYSEFVSAASTAVYGSTPVLSSLSTAVWGTPAPAYQSALDAAGSHYAVATAAAMANMAALLEAASSAVGKTSKSPAQSVLESISSQYDAAVAAAAVSLSSASYAASTAVYGTSTGSVESAASVASENWAMLVSKASERIYGSPTPVYESLMSQAGGYSAQITDSAAAQYSAVQIFVSELIIGKEPDFTDSVMNRLSEAYYTGYHITLASSASSFASEAYESAASVASSVSSVASEFFTPPPEVSSILDSVTEQLNAAVDAASLQIYGSSTGVYEQATSAVAGSYASASSMASVAVYGTQTGYGEAAQSQISDVMSSAQNAISIAIYGTPTGSLESATSVAGDTFASVSSVVAENMASAGSVMGDASSAVGDMYATAAAKVSEAVYGPEQGAVESAQSRIMEGVESAKSRIAEMMASATDGGSAVLEAVKSSVDEAASSVSSVVSSATDRVKDEL